MAGQSPGWVHVARFGVHDPDRGLRGYRLTFRAVGVDDNDVTAAIAAAFSDSGVGALAGDQSVLVTATLPFLTGELPFPFPPGQVVLEIPAGAVEEVGEERLGALVDDGFALCAPVRDPLTVAVLPQSIAFVSVDAGSPYLAPIAEQARAHERTSVAVGITDPDLLERAKAAGCDLLVGPAVSMPQLVRARALPSSRVAAMRLIGLVDDPDVSVKEVEEIVKTDASLSYRLLRAANSASVAAAHPTASVRDAIMRIGLRQLQSWLLLMLIADVSDAAEDQMCAAVTRARACELLAKVAYVQPGHAFVVGLLSAVAPQLGREPGDLGEELALDATPIAALRCEPGPLHDLLAAVERYEAAMFDVEALTAGTGDGLAAAGGEAGTAAGPSVFEISHSWLEAMAWSLQACRATAHDLEDAS